MKLISLYIENFGGLHQYALNFSDGINTVTEPNGFGKTTLAEFIRAMLYGFPRKTKTLDKSRRRKYMPWNGGQFGGNLVFEHQGRRYRVERTFGAIPKEDTFLVIDLATNKRTSRFSEDLGQELFGLDADSFERSTYLPQSQEAGSFATASIQTKLTRLIEDSGEIADFDKAMAALRTKRSTLIPYRGSGGSVAETAAVITRLQLQLDEAKQQEAQLHTVRAEVAQVEKTLETAQNRLTCIGEELTEASCQQADCRRQQEYEQLCSRHRKTAERISHCRKKYPRGLPREAELRNAEIAAATLLQREENSNMPTAEQLERCRAMCEAYEKSRETLSELRCSAAELTQKRQMSAPQTGTAILLWFLAVAGLFGGAILALRQHVYALPVLCGGGAALMCGIILTVLRSRKRHSFRQNVSRKIADLNRQADMLDRASENNRAEITAFLAMYGITAQPSQFAAALTQLEQRSAAFAQQCADAEVVKRFLDGLGLMQAQDIHTALRSIREDICAMQAAEAFLAELEAQIKVMENTYGEILYAEFRPTADPAALREEERLLRAKLTEDTSRLLHLRQKAELLQASITEIPQLQQQLADNQQKLAHERENVRILDATMEFLQQSRENLATTYLGTIRSRFGYYLSQLNGVSDDAYLIGTDFEILLERQGKARELAYFSAGQNDLLMLCMRLALVDAMFKEQDIFVILDDPFVNLDDAHMAQARRLLHKLASQRQILYLTCHSSRNI